MKENRAFLLWITTGKKDTPSRFYRSITFIFMLKTVIGKTKQNKNFNQWPAICH